MRKGTVKWKTGKHPVVKHFTSFLADLEELVGTSHVVHGPYSPIRTHPQEPTYSLTIYDTTTRQAKIIAKYGGLMQQFYVKDFEETCLPILRAFVEHYPDPNFLEYLISSAEKQAGLSRNEAKEPAPAHKQVQEYASAFLN